MYAVVIDDKFTGTVYDEITQNVTDWCEKYGASLVKVDGELKNMGTDEDPDYGSPNIEQIKEQLLTKAKQDFELGIKELIGEVPYIEITSWDKQEQEARSLLADSAATTPFIDALLIGRNLGETREELAGKIVANADAYAIGAAQLLGEYQAKVKEIEGMV